MSKELRRGTSLAVQFAADSIVLVRTAAATLFAFEDRGAHRQVPLSMGRVDCEYLQCAYHGWRYDALGACAAPGIHGGGTCVRGYPVLERDGLIHVFPSDSVRARQVPTSEIAEASSGAFLCIPFRREMGCHYSFVHENLMDMSHHILHRRWTGRFRPMLLGMRATDRQVAVEYAADFRGASALLRILPAAILRFQSGIAGDAGDASDRVTIETEYPYQSLVYRLPGLDEPLLRLWNAYIPVGAAEAITRPVGVLLVRKPRISGLLWLLKPFLLAIAQRGPYPGVESGCLKPIVPFAV